MTSRPQGTTWPAGWCSQASDCSPRSGVSTTRRGPGSPRACRCCGGATTGLGEIAAGRGQPHRAGQLLGAGQALLPATHPLLRVRVPYDLPAKLAAARTAGDPVAFDRGMAEGQAWTIDQAVAAGLATTADPDADVE